MHTTDYYSNRDIDASIMTARLEWGREITTEQALERIAGLKEQRTEYIRLYKDVRALDCKIGSYLLLIHDRELWSSVGPCDDCSDWAGAL